MFSQIYRNIYFKSILIKSKFHIITLHDLKISILNRKIKFLYLFIIIFSRFTDRNILNRNFKSSRHTEISILNPFVIAFEEIRYI